MLLRGGGVMLPGGVLYKQECVIELRDMLPKKVLLC